MTYILEEPGKTFDLAARDATALMQEIYEFVDKQEHEGPGWEREGPDEDFSITLPARFDPIPADWATRMNRIMRDLQASLHQLVKELVTMPVVEGGSRFSVAKGPGFPVCLTREDFEKELNRGYWKKAFQAGGVRMHTELVLRIAQPFSTHPDNPQYSALWLMHQLANENKHGDVRQIA